MTYSRANPPSRSTRSTSRGVGGSVAALRSATLSLPSGTTQATRPSPIARKIARQSRYAAPSPASRRPR